MYVRTVQTLQTAFEKYQLKQRAILVKKDVHTAVARLGDQIFNYSDIDKYWKEQTGETEPSPEVQAKLNSLLQGRS